MPKRKWDEEELRGRVLELRRKGKSYREIAGEIGCSVFTVSKILSPIENPQSRLRQVAELAMRVEELSKSIDELTKKLKGCRSRLEELKPVEELRSWLSRIDERLSKVEGSIKELRAEVKEVASRVDSLDDKMGWIEKSVALRLGDDLFGCKYIDEDGYCTRWHWRKRVEGLDMRRDLVGDRVVYRLNVKRHPLICTACPAHEPRG
jgi:predicted nuclease with TOPRIM domain